LLAAAAGVGGALRQGFVRTAREAQQVVARSQQLLRERQAEAARGAGEDGEVTGAHAPIVRGQAATTMGKLACTPSLPARKGTVTSSRSAPSRRQMKSRSLWGSPSTYNCVVSSSRRSSFTLK